jgi:hypothetical protein
MKLGKHEVTIKNAFKYIWTGCTGLLMLIMIIGNWCWQFTLWFGKLFLKFGESYDKHIDKKLKEIDSKSR